MAAGLLAINLNVFPFNQSTVIDYEGGGAGLNAGTAMSNHAIGTGGTAHTDAGALQAFPTTGSGGTAGVYTPAGNVFIAGFLDGSQVARLFYTDGSTIALPTLKSITQTQYSDAGQVGLSGLGTKGGGFKVTLTPASNNLIDATSPMSFYLDGYAILIVAGTLYG